MAMPILKPNTTPEMSPQAAKSDTVSDLVSSIIARQHRIRSITREIVDQGRELVILQEQVGWGEWERWFNESPEADRLREVMTLRTARRYRKLAEYVAEYKNYEEICLLDIGAAYVRSGVYPASTSLTQDTVPEANPATLGRVLSASTQDESKVFKPMGTSNPGSARYFRNATVDHDEDAAMIRLHNENCISGLRSRQEKFDLVVTSPPYNAGKEYESVSSPEEYKQFAQDWFRSVENVLADNGSLWVNVGYMIVGENQTLPLSYLYHSIAKLPFVQEIVWSYDGGMAYKARFSHRTERWMWFAKNPATAQFNLDAVRTKNLTTDPRNNSDGKNPTDMWNFNRVTNNSKQKTTHPCQFPEAMIERIVTACSNYGDLILDPFMGSGTVPTICKQLGRRCVGYEIDREYWEIARNRVKNRVIDVVF